MNGCAYQPPGFMNTFMDTRLDSDFSLHAVRPLSTARPLVLSSQNCIITIRICIAMALIGEKAFFNIKS